MNEERLHDAIGLIGEDLVEAVEALRTPRARGPKRRTLRRPYAAVAAACLCVVVLAAALLPRLGPRSGDSSGTGSSGSAGSDAGIGDTGDGPPSQGGAPYTVIGGTTYIVSSHLSSYDELPEGFGCAGRIDGGEFDGAQFFTNPDITEHIYLYIETAADGTIDPESGAAALTELHMAYVRFVRKDVRGKDFVSFNGQLYISMWHAGPDVPDSFYDEVRDEYSLRVEGEPPEGFESAGTAEFSGYDVYPEGRLSSNEGAVEVFVNPGDDRVLLVPAVWHTSAPAEGRETRHEGFIVYIRYDKEVAK